MEKVAQCMCGQFRAVVTGEPKSIAICHCLACKRRTGSAFAYNAFYPVSDVRLEGTYKIHVHEGQEGRKGTPAFLPGMRDDRVLQGREVSRDLHDSRGRLCGPGLPRAFGLGLRRVDARMGRPAPRYRTLRAGPGSGRGTPRGQPGSGRQIMSAGETTMRIAIASWPISSAGWSTWWWSTRSTACPAP